MIVLQLLLLLIALTLAWFVIPAFARQRGERMLSAACAARRAIVLSYDDGPGAVLTDQLVALLKQRDVQATFFVIGQRVRERPEVIMRLQRDGHDIGGHTEQHCNAWKVSPWRGIRDMRTGQRTLQELGAQPYLFRPPFGKSTLGTLIFGWHAKLRFSYWTVDTRDSWEAPRSVTEVLAMLRRQQGGVVLMHDCDAPVRAPQHHPGRILALTEAIIDFAEKEGFTILRFSDIHAASTQRNIHV